LEIGLLGKGVVSNQKDEWYFKWYIYGVGVLRMVLLKFEMLEIDKTYYLKYYQ